MAVKQINKVEDFENIIKDGRKTIVDFYADWCGPCKLLAPLFEEVSQEYSNINFVKVDVDKFSDIAQEYGIYSVPTLIIFQEGSEIKRSAGFIPKDQLVDLIK